MNPVTGVSAYSNIGQIQPTNQSVTPSQTTAKGSFSQLVEGFVAQTNADQVASDQAIDDLVTGKTDNVQQVVLAIANAEMSFQLFMEIRNKLIDSYNDLMRMQF